MRKIIACLVFAALATASCKKDKQFSGGNSAQTPGKYQTKSGSIIIGSIHNAGVIAFYEKYGYGVNLTFREVDSLTHGIVDSLLGTSLNQPASTVARFNWIASQGILRDDGHFKDIDSALLIMASIEPDAELRDIFQDIIMNRDTTSVFITYMSQQINGFVSPEQSVNDRAQGFREIYEYSDGLTYMGYNLPDDVAAADAIGFGAGDLYARQTNGGRELHPEWGESYHDLSPNLYWAMSFSISFSNYVACHSMTAH